jgi:hypothetical protein
MPTKVDMPEIAGRPATVNCRDSNNSRNFSNNWTLASVLEIAEKPAKICMLARNGMFAKAGNPALV